MANLIRGLTDSHVLLLGNEALARGALEAGVQVCAGYPGTPSTEIIQSLIDSARDTNLYAEWSVNEKVAVEVAAAAAFSGLKSLASMKNAGLNVASDALMHLNLAGVGEGAMVVILCDDPQAHASGDEMDTRHIAEIADVPLLEPSDPQEAKDIIKFAFELSDKFKTYCIVRGYTRLSHSRGRVILDSLPKADRKASFDVSKLITPYATASSVGYPPQRHSLLHENMEKIREIFETSHFNFFTGTSNSDLLIICSGSGWPCSMDAIETLGLIDRISILKLGTLWPFPRKLVTEHLKKAKQVLVVEEVDSIIEGYVKQTLADSDIAHPLKILGKSSGHLNFYGEMTPNMVISALARIYEIDYRPQESNYERKVKQASELVIERSLPWCPGCPHRATFYALNQALQKVNKQTIVVGDIGCYTIDQWACGTNRTNACLAMGSSLGLASGFGQLDRFGSEQPVVAICGDSTFYHASIPGLINAVVNRSKMTLIILDNGTTAMTGFQPHPGSGKTAMGEETNQLKLEDIAHACGAKYVEVFDPFDLAKARKAIEMALAFDGVSVLVARRMCALLAQREKGSAGKKDYTYQIEKDRCSKCVIPAGEKIMPCAQACPAGNDIPTFFQLTRQGRFQEGVEVIHQGNPLPRVLGRVCYHPCEESCNRGYYDEAISIRAVERFLGDLGKATPSLNKREPKYIESVAVVGSGPAGLTCAYNLSLIGYPVTIFEALPVAGGMLAVGIPEYRLPKDVLQSEIKHIEEIGVRICLNSPIRSADDLLQKGYKAIFISTGAHKDIKLGVPGEEKNGVLSAISFLRDINLNKPVSLGKQVIIIGGGNAAIDSARAAVRKGVKKVSIIYRRSRAEMPASEEEITAAKEEGVEIRYQVAPLQILGEKRVTGVRCIRTKLGRPDETGRAHPIPLKGSEFDLKTDTVIVAVGQIPNFIEGLSVSVNNTIFVDKATLETRKSSIFAGGDVVTGPSYVANAVGDGRKAAATINRYLRGEKLKIKEKEKPLISHEELNLGCIPTSTRITSSTLPVEKRILDFAEIESTYSVDDAMNEANRCLTCGLYSEKCISMFNCPAIIRDGGDRHEIINFLCNGCGVCATLCPYGAITTQEKS